MFAPSAVRDQRLLVAFAVLLCNAAKIHSSFVEDISNRAHDFYEHYGGQGRLILARSSP